MTVPSLLILGTDAVLAAAPATPVQLAHACLAAGYAAAIPSSWGDELIAAHVMREVRAADSPRLQCSCPHVEDRLLSNGTSIAAVTIATVAPPVATALYLRAKFAGREVRIVFAGACPAGSHSSIDEWLKPEELSALLAARGIDPRTQPTEYDSVIPPDRRRFYSEPGGMPSRRRLLEGDTRVNLVELGGGDLIVEVAQQLLRTGRALVDVAASHGCTCSGAAGLAGLEYARARVQEREPPPANTPVIDDDVQIPIAVVATPPVAPAPTNGAQHEPVAAAPRRRSPPGMRSSAIDAAVPPISDTPRPLRRAYIAKRRSSPRGFRAALVSPPSMPAVPEAPVVEAGAQSIAPGKTSLLRGWLDRMLRALGRR